MKLQPIRVLSDDDVKAIHEATLDILSECGVKVHSLRMLDFLQQKGLSVDRDSHIVRFTRGCVEDALGTVPSRFDVFDRRGEYAFTIGDGMPKIAAGHNAVFWVDSETGETRPSTVADVELFARICEQLPCIHLIGIPVMPQDVPDPKATLLYGVKATVENSTKPVYFSTDNARVNAALIELARAAFSGDMSSQVYCIGQLSPTSPLFWEEGVVEALWDTVEKGVPLAILPEPNAGVSAPYTLAGLLTVNNAECLSGIVMTQLIKPGAKVLYANSWTTTDMRTGAALVGSTETTICRIAGTQLGQFYGVPTHTTAPNSDNHSHDEQNSWEKTLSQFCAVAAGTDLIVNCGMFATGMTCSHEQLVMDEEISAMCLRIARGIRVDSETIAADVIKAIGPQGETYLTADHTIKWLRSDEYITPRVSVRGSYAIWAAGGAKDSYQLAKEKVREYSSFEPEPLPADRLARLNKILSAFSG